MSTSQVINVSSITIVGNTVRGSINDVRDGDVGQDRTPLGVRSPVARRDINVKSTDGVGNTVRLPISHGAIEGSAVRPSTTNDVRDRDLCRERTTAGVRSSVTAMNEAQDREVRPSAMHTTNNVRDRDRPSATNATNNMRYHLWYH